MIPGFGFFGINNNSLSYIDTDNRYKNRGDIMLRLSSYSVMSSPLPKGGYAILNGITGAIDLISEELAELLLGLIENYNRHTINIPIELLSQDLLDDFIERGHFTYFSHEEEKKQVAYVAGILHDAEAKNPRFVIVPNLDCNYRCTYCFERPLQKSLNGDINTVMNDHQIDRMFNCIEKIQKEAGASGGQIILYGGEPLDSKNKDVIYKIVNHEKGKDFTFSAITNGHHLDAFLPLLNQRQINDVQVSIDGPKGVHDRRRIALDGQSSFDRIMSNVQIVLLKGDVNVNIRVHVDKSNLVFLDDLLEIFRREGFYNNKNITIYINVVYTKDDKGRIFPVFDINSLSKELTHKIESYKNVYLGAPQYNSDVLISGSLNKGKPYRLKSVYCAANSGMYIFVPDGNIYSCWESIGKSCSKIGEFTSDEGSVFDKDSLDKWFTRCVSDIDECLDCPYCLICGGGCAQYAEYNSGSVLNPFCDDFQKTYADVLARSVENFLEAQGL